MTVSSKLSTLLNWQKLVYVQFGQNNIHSTFDSYPRPATKETNVPLKELWAYCPNIYTVLLQQKEEDETEVDYRAEDGNNNMLQASTVSNRWDPVLWYSQHGYNVSEMIKAPGKNHRHISEEYQFLIR